MWIFGFGSLCWYTNFPVIRKMTGKIYGFSRRFWQASPDHRGYPDDPGRTAMLIPEKDGVVHGVAYQVPAEDVEETKHYLNWREKAGYTWETVTFYPDDNSEPFQSEVFGSPSEGNEFYMGPEDIGTTASYIIRCVGPSGTNLEYFLRVCHFIRQEGAEAMAKESYMFELEKEVLTRLKERGLTGDPVLHELGLVDGLL